MGRINRRDLLYAALPGAAAGGWMLAASAILSTGTKVDFTPLLWLDAVQWWWLDNWWITLWIVAAALLPSALLAIVIMVTVYRWRTRRRPILRARRDGRVRLVERGTSDNLGHSDWRDLASTRQLFPGGHPLWGGIAVAEEYRVDLDPKMAGVPFDPRNPRTWGQGGRTPLLIDDTTKGSGHSIIFAGSGAYKSTSALTGVALIGFRGGEVGMGSASALLV